MRVSFSLRSWRRDPRRDHRTLLHLLTALARIDADYLRASPGTPPIYSSGVAYRREPPGREEWQDIPSILAGGEGDCEDLACWRVAELWVRHGETDAAPALVWRTRPTGATAYHVIVRRATGGTEDPSRILARRPDDVV